MRDCRNQCGGGTLRWTALLAILVLALEVSSARGQGQWTELICSYPDWDCDKAQRVMMCESRGDPLAYSAGNAGLFQISYIHSRRVGGDLASLYDPVVNVRTAHSIWSEQGWGPWSYCGRGA